MIITVFVCVFMETTFDTTITYCDVFTYNFNSLGDINNPNNLLELIDISTILLNSKFSGHFSTCYVIKLI